MCIFDKFSQKSHAETAWLLLSFFSGLRSFHPDAVRADLYFAKFEQAAYGSLELILAHLHLLADDLGRDPVVKGKDAPFAFILAIMRSISRSI